MKSEHVGMPVRKREAALARIRNGGSALVAFSGGVDSSVLLALAGEALGRERVLAVTVDSPFVPRVDVAVARDLARGLGLKHETVALDLLALPELASNPPDRCYHCKKKVYSVLREMAAARGLVMLLDGSNADDAREFRPGTRAKDELGAVSPLAEAGLTKDEVRALARDFQLANADAPAQSCLATRFPGGVSLTREGLWRVEQAELMVRGLGFRVFRVRDHFPLARVEIALDEISWAIIMREDLVAVLREAGYSYATLDLGGYRRGSIAGVPAGGRQ